MWGSLFFGFFLLAKQKKETRPTGETNNLINLTSNRNQLLYMKQ
jgi:hypothetical protein